MAAARCISVTGEGTFLERWQLTLDELSRRAPLFERSAVAVGNFDGVHKGHVRILRLAVEYGGAAGETPVALTFFPHPRAVIGAGAPPALVSPEERDRLMGQAGIEAVVTLQFDADVAALPPERFVRDVLLEGLGARRVVVGDNFRFGRGAGGTTELLRQLGAELGFAVHVAETVRDEAGRVVSSTLVRELVRAGDVDAAARLLNRRYAVTGLPAYEAAAAMDGWLPVRFRDGLLVPGPGVYDVLVSAVDAGAAATPAVASVPSSEGGEPHVVHVRWVSGSLPSAGVRIEFVARREENH